MYIMPNELKIGYVITFVWLGDIRFLGFFFVNLFIWKDGVKVVYLSLTKNPTVKTSLEIFILLGLFSLK